MAMETKATLHKHDPCKEGKYRLIAVNKAGEAMSSKTLMAVP